VSDLVEPIVPPAFLARFPAHDWVAHRTPQLLPNLPAHVLVDNVVTVEGLKIYGSPFSPYFRDWAFNAPPLDDGGDEFMDRKFSRIPDDTDIFIIHGPPMGYGDSVSRHERVREQFTKTYGNLGQPAGSKVQNPS
jgi:hypothetical protein